MLVGILLFVGLAGLIISAYSADAHRRRLRETRTATKRLAELLEQLAVSQGSETSWRNRIAVEARQIAAALGEEE